MAKIIQLSDDLSNKIAAGEVVERPASVVKELMENAIDASSTVIEIDVEEAGLSSIRMIDNGVGIDAEDCKLAFQRHATSKIKDENDLFRVRTLGFRGEALPSIASVSHLEMKTSTGEGAGTPGTARRKDHFREKNLWPPRYRDCRYQLILQYACPFKIHENRSYGAWQYIGCRQSNCAGSPRSINSLATSRESSASDEWKRRCAACACGHLRDSCCEKNGAASRAIT